MGKRMSKEKEGRREKEKRRKEDRKEATMYIAFTWTSRDD